MEDLKEMINEFTNALLSVNRAEASAVLDRYYAARKDFACIEEIVSESLRDIGEGWDKGKVSLSQVYMSGVICEDLIDGFLPITHTELKTSPRIGIAVLLDHHSLGKKIVSSIIKSNGYELIDFGHGLSSDDIVRLAIKHKVDVVLISTLMLNSALKVKEIKDKLRLTNPDIKIIAGGAPFRLDNKLWQKVGADANGGNASDIMNIIGKVVAGK